MTTIQSAKNSFKFVLIRKLVPAIFNFMFLFAARRNKTLLVVKCDGIGDYLLFRNYLYFLKTSETYKDHKIYLLAGTDAKDLAIQLDSKVVDAFFWYSDSFFLKWDLVKLTFALQRLKLQTIIYPNYSRKFIIDELIKNIRAKYKIAVDGDLVNESAVLKKRADKYYSRLIHVDSAPLHEFERNKQIMEAIAGEQSRLSAPEIGKDSIPIIPNNSIIVFTGASTAGKKWSAINFNKLCRLISAETNAAIILIGGRDEDKETAVISDGIAPGRLSAPGSVSLSSLCGLIGGARMLISGDTVSVHMAAALSVPVVCIAKGDLYGRFVPYPPSLAGLVYTVFPDGYLASCENYGRYSSFDVNDVRVEVVYQAVKKILTGT